MMFARDAAKQAAAWEFIKFATGPVGATMMVNATGYMPASTIPAQREEMLGRFYRENPNHMVTFRQQDVITGWYAFPGQNALRITDTINDHLQSVVGKRAEPAAVLTRMAADVQALLPRAVYQRTQQPFTDAPAAMVDLHIDRVLDGVHVAREVAEDPVTAVADYRIGEVRARGDDHWKSQRSAMDHPGAALLQRGLDLRPDCVGLAHRMIEDRHDPRKV
jgi:hypothetical protein